MPNSRKQVHSSIYKPSQHLVNLVALHLSPVPIASLTLVCSVCTGPSASSILNLTLDLIASVCLGFALYGTM